MAIFFGFRKLITPMCGVLLLRAKVVGDERPLGHHRNLSSRRSVGSLGELDRFRGSSVELSVGDNGFPGLCGGRRPGRRADSIG